MVNMKSTTLSVNIRGSTAWIWYDTKQCA